MDQRKQNNGNGARRPWIQRYMPFLIFIITLLLGYGTALVRTWADTNIALQTAQANATTIKEREQWVNAIPHIQRSMDQIRTDFNDHRSEQRGANTSINSKIDQLLRNSNG